MRRSMGRHLDFLGPPNRGFSFAAMAAGQPMAPPEFFPQDYVAYLLYIDAEIEHGLMIQYLFAAYSIGGPQVPEKYQKLVRSWQEVVFGIAKEEMGHLICVQNVLRLIGAPLNLGREDYPWDTPFYPFEFYLEPLTLNSLAKYVFVEAPAGWTGQDADDIKKLLPASSNAPHQVAALFNLLIPLLQNPAFLPDEVFQSETWPLQAKFEEWGRGYTGGQRGNTQRANPPGAPQLLVLPTATRDDAVKAMKQVAEQGESTTDSPAAPPSHFQRFLQIFKEMRDLIPVAEKEGWSPTRPVAVNPYISAEDPALVGSPPTSANITPITYPEARVWGNLFNVRYRMLLQFLLHSFELTDTVKASGIQSLRGTVITAAFGEMYAMRAIAMTMVQLPVSKKPGEPWAAGPTFEMPYTLTLPIGERNRWRLHRQLLTAARTLLGTLLEIGHPSRRGYVRAMLEADENQMQLFDAVLTGIR